MAGDDTVRGGGQPGARGAGVSGDALKGALERGSWRSAEEVLKEAERILAAERGRPGATAVARAGGPAPRAGDQPERTGMTPLRALHILMHLWLQANEAKDGRPFVLHHSITAAELVEALRRGMDAYVAAAGPEIKAIHKARLGNIAALAMAAEKGGRG